MVKRSRLKKRKVAYEVVTRTGYILSIPLKKTDALKFKKELTKAIAGSKGDWKGLRIRKTDPLSLKSHIRSKAGY